MNTVFLIFFALLQIADIYTTTTALRQGGRELNPVLASLFERASPIIVMLVLKIAAVIALWFVDLHWLTALACALYIWVVAHNFHELKKH